MITLIIPTYKNPEYLDICLRSAIEQQEYNNEIIVAVDGFIEESKEVLEKYKDKIKVLDLVHNQGMQSALNLSVMNATNEIIFIVNDDNVFCSKWDEEIIKSLGQESLPFNVENKLEQPGLKLFHIQDIDFRSHHLLFKDCLKEIKTHFVYLDVSFISFLRTDFEKRGLISMKRVCLLFEALSRSFNRGIGLPSFVLISFILE